MEDRNDIHETRLQKERELLKKLEPANYKLEFPDSSRSLEIVTEVQSYPVKFFIHLPERYPFQSPKVSLSVSDKLTSLTEFYDDENILEHVLGESWIPVINLPSVIEKLVYYAHHSYKARGKSLLAEIFSIHWKWSIVIVILLALLVKVAMIAQPHSGYNNHPKYGDYEAQRHWMEITTNLSPDKWYKNSTENDLEYWGLDYPPLTAWHSWFFGSISSIIEPESMVLGESRGYLTSSHKLFMRISVILGDLFVYVPAIFMFFKMYYRYLSGGVKYSVIILVFLSPPLILIDNGHFQYNSIMLGFSLWAIVLVYYDYLGLSAILLALALNFKQMALYYVLPFLCIWIAKAWKRAKHQSMRFQPNIRWGIMIAEIILTLSNIAGCGIITTIILWIPWIGSVNDIFQVISRLFPFQRGIFEDKVATFWCISSIFIKYKNIFPISWLALFSALLTMIASLPFLILLFKRKPLNLSFLYALSGVSLSFFLFSYHVHEKTILIPLLPFTLLAIIDTPELFRFYVIIATFSMYPLMIKDGLRFAYFCLSIVFYIMAGDVIKTLNYFQDRKGMNLGFWYLGMLIIHLLEFIEPPQQYPYLFETLVAAYSFLGFGYIWWFTLKSHYQIKGESDPRYHLENRLRKKAKMS
ncbi:unnamed protein product [Blepharisma stoltei]|uniref:Alpha-1,3-glucosyltransferase n=1 Tax=Blepharisma stoltei TaxID=1481888 RepID=A0AAU9IRM3_9CILI|nr:unnamed protein product [Blepharisma stoltei]